MEITGLLLEKGANSVATDCFGLGLLHWAAFAGHKSVVQLILEKGATSTRRITTSRRRYAWRPQRAECSGATVA
jgi:ankyrin repeat protein